MKKAIVCKPAPTLRHGLTRSDLGLPDYAHALVQHEEYCAALKRCGLELLRLDPAASFPDSVFVEDTAVLTGQCVILTRPGATSRQGEVSLIEPHLRSLIRSVKRIEEPGTLDGGDVCVAGNRFFIGLSERTNEAGARQLGRFLEALGHSYACIDIRSISELLHLKSALTYLGDNRLVVTDALAGLKVFAEYEIVRVAAAEEYAANCVRVNDHVLIVKGCPAFSATLAAIGYQTIALDMSEFQKLDGGLSCLSLRF